MKTRGVRISKYYTGLCNQLTNLIHGIMDAITDAVDVLVVDDFKMEIHTDKECPIENVLDLPSMNEYFRATYGLTIIGKRQMSLKIKSALYGTMGRYIDIHKELWEKHCIDDRLIIPPWSLNKIRYDPAEGIAKSLRITYIVDIYKIIKIYTEEGAVVDIPVKSVDQYKEYFESWPIEPATWFHHLLNKIVFHTYFHNIVNKFTVENRIDVMKPVHVIHLRLEPDAIYHWSKQNNITPQEFYQVLCNKYIKILSEHHFIKSGTVIILSYTEEGPVFDWLTKNNISFVCIPKNRTHGREWNAVLDIVLAKTYANGVLVGSVDPFRMQGSSFTYFLMHMLNPVYTILIDIERISEKELIC